MLILQKKNGVQPFSLKYTKEPESPTGSTAAVDISPSYFIVGSAGDSTALIYNRSTGALLHTIPDPNAPSSDQFGSAVAITESYAIVGANAADNASGKAYIYNPSTGALLHTLTNPNAFGVTTGDKFASAVAINESYAVSTANWESDAGGAQSGKAYIFNPATGALLHTLDNPNTYGSTVNDYFGDWASLSNSYLAIGAHGDRSAGGSVYIFNPATGGLIQSIFNPNVSGSYVSDYFGHVIDMTDSYLVSGAHREDEGGSNSGTAYIFNPVTGVLLHTLDNPNQSSNDNFGNSVAITNTYTAVAAYGEDGFSGKVYIFNTSTGALTHTFDNPNFSGGTANDLFGASIAIDGSQLIITAAGEKITYVYNL